MAAITSVNVSGVSECSASLDHKRVKLDLPIVKHIDVPRHTEFRHMSTPIRLPVQVFPACCLVSVNVCKQPCGKHPKSSLTLVDIGVQVHTLIYEYFDVSLNFVREKTI